MVEQNSRYYHKKCNAWCNIVNVGNRNSGIYTIDPAAISVIIKFHGEIADHLKPLQIAYNEAAE